jgi:hypothetical protein
MSCSDYPCAPAGAERERRTGRRARYRPEDAQNAPICAATAAKPAIQLCHIGLAYQRIGVPGLAVTLGEMLMVTG